MHLSKRPETERVPDFVAEAEDGTRFEITEGELAVYTPGTADHKHAYAFKGRTKCGKRCLLRPNGIYVVVAPDGSDIPVKPLASFLP